MTHRIKLRIRKFDAFWAFVKNLFGSADLILMRTLKIHGWGLLGLLGLLCACSSTVQVASNPSGADVWVKPVGSGTEKKLGQTPLNFKPSELEGVPSGSGPLRFRMTKDGYKPVDLIVTDAGASELSVNVDLEAGPGFDNPVVLNSHLEKIFTAQQLIQMKNFDEAQKILEGVRERVPTLAVVHELLGGVYFLKGEKLKSLDAFKRALALNPNSVDAINMTETLARSPASAEAAVPVASPAASEGGNSP